MRKSHVSPVRIACKTFFHCISLQMKNKKRTEENILNDSIVEHFEHIPNKVVVPKLEAQVDLFFVK